MGMNFFEYLNDECTKSLAALALDCDDELIVTICNNIISALNEFIDDKVETINASRMLFLKSTFPKFIEVFLKRKTTRFELPCKIDI